MLKFLVDWVLYSVNFNVHKTKAYQFAKRMNIGYCTVSKVVDNGRGGPGKTIIEFSCFRYYAQYKLRNHLSCHLKSLPCKMH